jgi:SAM-dependent methyltransferase
MQVKVNLGSGFIGLPDWLNYDNSIVARFGRHRRVARLLVALKLLPPGYLKIQWPPIILHDCRKGLPLASDSVDFVYTSHFFEHLYRHEVVALLRESLRVLKPSGRIRVVLPDLDKLLAIYQGAVRTPFPGSDIRDAAPVLQADLLVAQFFPHDLNLCTPPSRIQRFQERFLQRHKWMYTAESFAALLRHAGFQKVERKGYRESDCADVQKLDVLPEVSFYLEAEKVKQ